MKYTKIEWVDYTDGRDYNIYEKRYDSWLVMKLMSECDGEPMVDWHISFPLWFFESACIERDDLKLNKIIDKICSDVVDKYSSIGAMDYLEGGLSFDYTIDDVTESDMIGIMEILCNAEFPDITHYRWNNRADELLKSGSLYEVEVVSELDLYWDIEHGDTEYIASFYDKVLKWLDENISGEYYYDGEIYETDDWDECKIIYFEVNEDVMAFKLRWL